MDSAVYMVVRSKARLQSPDKDNSPVMNRGGGGGGALHDYRHDIVLCESTDLVAV